jgi:hypothetical protein
MAEVRTERIDAEGMKKPEKERVLPLAPRPLRGRRTSRIKGGRWQESRCRPPHRRDTMRTNDAELELLSMSKLFDRNPREIDHAM